MNAQLRLKSIVLGVSGLAAFGAAAAALAQDFPTKIVRVINPAAPGGNSDVLFRLLQPKMSEVLGQNLVMDYRPGAGGTIGVELTARAPADGYTTALVAASFLINPAVRTKLPYQTPKDFTPLGLIVNLPAGFMVHPSMPVRSVKEMIAFAKARPDQILYASSGTGAIGHMAGELFNSMAGVKMVHVPYKGAGPSVVDLVGGHVHTTFVSLPLVMGHIHTGRLRILAQCGARRVESLPDVVTMQEAGLPGFIVSSGFSFIGPAGIARPVAEKLNNALAQAVRDPANRKQLIAQAADPVGSSIDEHAAIIKAEIARWTRVAKEAHIRVD
ncbi:MAG: tripartite tricarboxylate transporter substrate binding protein [Burkholderiales bacterium]|nr:tripartite tricarboxylate transporter substrate binding protein [Burkholderiales bacterium]